MTTEVKDYLQLLIEPPVLLKYLQKKFHPKYKKWSKSIF